MCEKPFSTFVHISVNLLGSAGRAWQFSSHPETGRRTTMCEASVALAIERSAAGRATTRDEYRTERNRGRTKDGIRHPRRDAKHGSIKSKHGRDENAKSLKRFSTRNVLFVKCEDKGCEFRAR